MNAPSAPSVLLAGASGLVGQALIGVLLQEPHTTVHAVVRRTPAVRPSPDRLRWIEVDFARLPALPNAHAAYCALGTTIKVAGSQAAFRAVDLDAVVAFARAARAAGATRLAVVSALGANASASSFYNRVKGEMEAAVAGLGFDSVVVARPSLLAGPRGALGQPERVGEQLALRLTQPFASLIPKAWRPIQASTVARALVAAMHQARPGMRVVESGELQVLGA